MCSESIAGTKVWHSIDVSMGDTTNKLKIYFPHKKENGLCVAKGTIIRSKFKKNELVTLLAVSDMECDQVNPKSYFFYEDMNRRCNYNSILTLHKLVEDFIKDEGNYSIKDFKKLRGSGLTIENISSMVCNNPDEYTIGIEDSEISEYGFSLKFKKIDEKSFQLLKFSSAVE